MKILLFFVFSISISNLFSKEIIVDAKFFIRKPHKSQVLKDLPSISFELNYSVAREILYGQFETLQIKNFPLLGTEFVDLVLNPSFIPFDQNTEWYRGTRNGLVRTSAPNLLPFFGKIKGDDNSFVFISLTDFGLIGTIQKSNNEIFTIAPASNSKNGEHLLATSNSQTFNEESIFKCLTEDYSGESNEANDLLKFKDEPLYSSQLLEVKLACEGTSDFFSIFNDATKAKSYISAVIAQSSKIYEEFFNVRLYIGYVIVWEDSWEDPYTGTADLSQKLQKMPSIWRGKTIDRALTVLFANLANQPSNSTVAGISFGGTPYFGSLCNKDWGYCVLGIRGNAKYPTLNYTWDVNVATHEMGHNFSLPHTHNCYWLPNMIDTCVTGQVSGVGDACIKNGNPIPRPGTIMSYCHVTNSTHSVQLIFHPRQLPLARRAAQNSSCVKVVNQPYISLLNPIGGATYIAGTNLKIRWTSSKVNFLTIFYSIDGGKNWNIIADNVSAPDSIFNWTLPNVNTAKAMVLIRDKGNANVADTSITTFSILQKTITVLTPLKEEFSQGEKVSISWKATLIDTFVIEFSFDGGNTYQVIKDAFVGSSFDWTAPNIISDSCMIRVKSIDSTIVAYSPLFKVGLPVIEILFPVGGNKLCKNNYYNVKWTSQYINRIILEYSTNGGESWRKISLAPVLAKSSEFLWRTPNVTSENCFIRVKSTFSDEPLAQISSPFILDSCTTIGDVEPSENGDENFILENLSLELENNTLNFNLILLAPQPTVQIEIFDFLGRMIFSDEYITNGLAQIPLSITLPGVSQDIIYINIKSKSGFISVPFRIIK